MNASPSRLLCCRLQATSNFFSKIIFEYSAHVIKLVNFALRNRYGKVRDIIIYKNYFLDFYNDQSEKVQSKIDYVLKIVATQQSVPLKFLRSLESEKGLFEVRIEMESNIYRIFCCFDNGNLVVLFNGFRKKSQKTPKDEIARAMRIMDEYFNDKNK